MGNRRVSWVVANFPTSIHPPEEDLRRIHGMFIFHASIEEVCLGGFGQFGPKFVMDVIVSTWHQGSTRRTDICGYGMADTTAIGTVHTGGIQSAKVSGHTADLGSLISAVDMPNESLIQYCTVSQGGL